MERKRMAKGLSIMLPTLAVTFALCWLGELLLHSETVTALLCVLGVFFISLFTDGYSFGVISTVASVFIAAVAPTVPNMAFSLGIFESVFLCLVLLAVSVFTSLLTQKIKNQHALTIEAESEKMRANLLRAVSHDLRTPLTSIYGACSAICQNYDTIPKQTQLRLLSESCDRCESLVRIVENLLSVTRVGEGGVRVKKTPTVLEELIGSTVTHFKRLYPKAPLTVKIPDEFLVVPMDALLIEQVLINLLENAFFHAEGATRIELSVTLGKRYAHFAVSDNGAGIRGEVFPKLFTGGLISKNVPADGHHGMGIGLSVCQAVVRAHGTKIRAFNQKAGGACFTFALETEDSCE